MFELITMGKRALQATEKAIETTSHNISNINTEGYSRQRVVQESAYPIDMVFANVGTGSYIQNIERVRDQFLDAEYRKGSTELGYWSTRSDTLNQMESQLLEPSEFGLGSKINAFFDKWDALANNPTNNNSRSDVLEASIDLTEGFQNLHSTLATQKNDLNNDISGLVERINQISRDMSEVLTSIQNSEGPNKEACDFRDRFDSLVDELSTYGDVTIQKRENGQTIVYFGTDEISRTGSYREMTGRYQNVDGENICQVEWADGNDSINGLRSGKLKSLLDVRDEVIPGYMANLDNLAKTFAEKVNEIHFKGYDNNSTPQSGHYFFDPSVTGAADFCVSGSIMSDVNNIAVSQTGSEGDNRIALEMTDLRNQKLIEGRYSLSEGYGQLLYDIGSDASNATSNTENKKLSLEQTNNFRESIKGVSMNEETANLLKFQQIYQAAAKIISIADEMTKIVIGLVK